MAKTASMWVFPKMVVPNNHGFSWVFLLKMIILGCFGGTTILGTPHVFAFFLLCNTSYSTFISKDEEGLHDQSYRQWALDAVEHVRRETLRSSDLSSAFRERNYC